MPAEDSSPLEDTDPHSQTTLQTEAALLAHTADSVGDINEPLTSLQIVQQSPTGGADLDNGTFPSAMRIIQTENGTVQILQEDGGLGDEAQFIAAGDGIHIIQHPEAGDATAHLGIDDDVLQSKHQQLHLHPTDHNTDEDDDMITIVTGKLLPFND